MFGGFLHQSGALDWIDTRPWRGDQTQSGHSNSPAAPAAVAVGWGSHDLDNSFEFLMTRDLLSIYASSMGKQNEKGSHTHILYIYIYTYTYTMCMYIHIYTLCVYMYIYVCILTKYDNMINLQHPIVRRRWLGWSHRIGGFTFLLCSWFSPVFLLNTKPHLSPFFSNWSLNFSLNSCFNHNFYHER